MKQVGTGSKIFGKVVWIYVLNDILPTLPGGKVLSPSIKVTTEDFPTISELELILHPISVCKTLT